MKKRLGSNVQTFQKSQKKNNRLKHSVIRFAPLIVVIYLVIAAFTTFQDEDRTAVAARNKDYIKDITLAMADKIDDILSNSLKSIEALAKLSSDVIENGQMNSVFLAELEKMVQFDHVQFIDTNGIAQMSSGEKMESANFEGLF